MSPINPEGWQAHSEGGVGQIRIAIGYLFGSLQPDPGSASIPHHYQGAQKQGMQLERWDGHTIHSAKSLKGCGPLTWVKSILKKYHSPAIGETKYILPTAVVFPAQRLHCACTCRLATPGSQR